MPKTMIPTIEGLPEIPVGEERDWELWWKKQRTTMDREPERKQTGLWPAAQAPIIDGIYYETEWTARGYNPQEGLDWATTFGCPTIALRGDGSKQPATSWKGVGPGDSAGPDDGAGRAALTGFTFDVIDLDGVQGLLSWNKFVRPILSALGLPAIALQRTRRGWHLIIPSMGTGNTAGVFPGIDVRGTGGYIVAAPTKHADGRYYLHYAPTPETMQQAVDWSRGWQEAHPGIGMAEILGAYAQDKKPTPVTSETKPQPKQRVSSPARPKAACTSAYTATGATSRRMAMWQSSGAARQIDELSSAGEGRRNDLLNRACYTLAKMFETTPVPGIDPEEVWRDVKATARSIGLDDEEIDDVMSRAIEAGRAAGPATVPADLAAEEDKFQARQMRAA